MGSGWALPSGCTGNQCFYNYTSLVGGNGTKYDAGKVSEQYLRIDADGTPGYLTVRS